MEEQKKNPAQGLSESEQVQVRRQKLADLQAAGRDPFTLTKFPQDAYSADLKEEFKDLPNETDSGKKVALAGRLMSKRVMGKASFAHLRDDKGDIQLYVRRDELGDDAYAAFKKLDVGDIIGVKGEVFRTKTGELSARAEEITLLAKSLRPLPEKFHGLTDTEMRYRQRYVDLIANPEVKETFVKRSKILKEIRAYLDEKGFLEVDTPILTPFEIGASARPFYTHHNTLNMDMVLRIETELYLKRLIVGGMDRVYEVGRIFRNEGMDPKHNPEFTTIELYQAFTDFHGMMDLVEELYKRLALKICGSMVIPYQGKQIDMSHWERLTMVEAVKKYSGVDFNDWKSDEDAIASAKEHHVELPEVPTKGAILAEFFDAFVEDKLIQPTFIYDYPVEISPLAKRKPDDPAFTERFEYFIDCTEYGNAFSELNDPIDQKGRFERQVAERKAIEPDCKAQVDYDYVNALEYGLPPTGGLGFGVDRLVNGVSAVARYGKPLIIVDIGTATTFDAIDENGAYQGGAIFPGLKVAMEALFLKASKLPRVDIERPENAIGKTTVQSMQSGAVRGYVGALTGIITDIQKELGGKARVVATGGMGRMMAEYCDLIDDVDPNLTLEGLRLIYENNREAFENRKLDMNNSVIEVTEEGAWQENK